MLLCLLQACSDTFHWCCVSSFASFCQEHRYALLSFPQFHKTIFVKIILISPALFYCFRNTQCSADSSFTVPSLPKASVHLSGSLERLNDPFVNPFTLAKFLRWWGHKRDRPIFFCLSSGVKVSKASPMNQTLLKRTSRTQTHNVFLLIGTEMWILYVQKRLRK